MCLLFFVSFSRYKLSFRYYYNHKSGVSTWIKPHSLRHVIFAHPKDTGNRRNDNLVGASATDQKEEEKEDTVSGFLDRLSSNLMSFIPNPWADKTTPLVRHQFADLYHACFQFCRIELMCPFLGWISKVGVP